MTIELGELELVWPPHLFAEEARELLAAGRDDESSLGWLLDEAFYGDTGLALYRQEALKAPFGGPNAYQALNGIPVEPAVSPTAALVRDLTERADLLRRYAPKRYFRARQGPGDPPAALTMPQLKSQFARVVQELSDTGYYNRAFGSSCVDDADDPVAEGQRQLAELLGENPSSPPFVRLWPMHPGAGEDPSALWSDGQFYDLVEALHDLVARPRSRNWHDYGREWDYGDFARRPGQAVYRWRVNELLDRSEVPLRLAETGEDTGLLVTSAGDARDDLVERALRSPEPQVQERVAHAVARFRDRHATARTKHDATRTLADVLELRRALLKEELLSADEGALFHIANGFQIRHLSERQKADYDPVFLDWVFWLFLGTIELTNRLLDRQDDAR